MKRCALMALSALTLSLSSLALAENNYNLYYPIGQHTYSSGNGNNNGSANWFAISPLYTDWTVFKPLFNCSNWTPDPATYTTTATFSQKSTNCQTQRSRNIQPREQNKKTEDIRFVGNTTTEIETLYNQSATRDYSVTITEPQKSGSVYSCSTWTPSPDTVYNDKTFTQTANDCKQDYVTYRNENYIDHVTKSNIFVSSIPKLTTNTESSTRTMAGTKQYYVTTPYNLTDSNWVKGVGRALIAFFVSNTEENRKQFVVGRKVKFANGEVRSIVKTAVNANIFYNIHVSGAVMNGNEVGYPNEVILIEN